MGMMLTPQLLGLRYAGFNAEQGGRSLIFDPTDSPLVSLTPSVSGNRRTFTIHLDFQVAKLDTYQALLMVYGANNDNGVFVVALGASNKLVVSGNSTTWRTSVEDFVDPTGRVQVTLAFDTTEADEADRLTIYKGLREIVDWGNYAAVALNHEFAINHTYEHRIGHGFGLGAAIFSGLFGSVSIVEGQKLTASDFITTDNRGVELFSKYSGDYGSDGAPTYLDFNDNSTLAALGTNSEGTNWSMSGLTTGESVDGSWSNIYAMISLVNKQSVVTVSDGGRKSTYAGTANTGTALATVPFPTTGKWYYEHVCDSAGGSDYFVGITRKKNATGVTANIIVPGTDGEEYAYRAGTGNKMIGGTVSAYGASYGAADVIGVAYNADDLEVTFYKGGISQGTITGVTAGQYIAFTQTYNGGAATLRFREDEWTETPPTDFKSLCTANLPTPAIVDGGEHFEIITWVGDGATTGTRDIVGDFNWTPGLIWEKDRSVVSSHRLTDVVRGFGNAIAPDSTAVEFIIGGDIDYLTAIPGGFRLDNTLATTLNVAGVTYIAWCWKMGGAGVSNTDGSTTTTVSANTVAGSTVMKWTGTGAIATLGTGLNNPTAFGFVKNVDATNPWLVYHQHLTASSYLRLNDTTAIETNVVVWNNTEPTAGLITVGTGTSVNNLNDEHVGFFFVEIEGYSKFDSYTGTGTSDGPEVYCGFKPRYILIKRTNSTGDWIVYDTVRDTYNLVETLLFPSSSDADTTSATSKITVTAIGFKISGSAASLNAAGGTFVYAAFADIPFGGKGIAPAPAF